MSSWVKRCLLSDSNIVEVVALYRSQAKRTESIGNNPKLLLLKLSYYHMVRFTRKSSPLGCHISNGKAGVDWEAAHCLLGTSKFDSVVKNFVAIEEAAECNDDIFSSDALWQNTSKMASGHRRNLPPCSSGCPYTSCISPDDRRSEASNTSIMVRMAVGSNRNSTGPCISLLYHDLMSDTTAGRVSLGYLLLLCECLNLLVLLKVRFALVLDIVVEC